MSAHSSPDTGLPAKPTRFRPGRFFLRALLVLSLVYYVALVLDLVIHPSGPGIGVSGFSVAEETIERYIAALIGTGTIVVGIFITRRVPGNRIGMLLTAWGVGYTGYEMRVDYGSPLLTSLTHLVFIVSIGAIAFPALIVLLLILPTGQVYPRGAARWLALYIILYEIVGLLGIMAQSPAPSVSGLGQVSLPVNPLFVPALAPYYPLINGAFGTIFALLGLIAAVVSLILRYRAAQTRERQQIKWFVWVTSLVVVLAIPDAVIPSGPNNTLLASVLVRAYLIFFYALLGAGPAIGIGLAILRSRLWEIDIIINRTLVYGSLTALLALLYFGLIFGLQFLFQGTFHQNNDVAIVVSTLVIAALFQPLRRRIQRLIDRRFYRSKYNAARTLAQFSATLRNEVELGQLSERLIMVVEETMQPAHVSLWLRPTGHEKIWLRVTRAGASPAPTLLRSSGVKPTG